jgi:hypothetical protein
VTGLPQRYWESLTTGGGETPGPRAWEGYGLWRRYWSALLGFPLPPQPTTIPETIGGLTEPTVEGGWTLLPRFDRLTARMAATEETARPEARWTVGEREFVIRESGPGEVELLVRAADEVLPVDVTTPHGTDRYYLLPGSDEMGVIHFAAVTDWLDIRVGEGFPATEWHIVDGAAVARSVAATPDSAMPAWAAIVAARPADDPLSRAIRDAAG